MAVSRNLVYGPWSKWVFSDEHKQHYMNRQVQDGPRSWVQTRWETENIASAPPASIFQDAFQSSGVPWDEREYPHQESQFDRDKNTASVPPDSTNVSSGPPRQKGSQTSHPLQAESGYMRLWSQPSDSNRDKDNASAPPASINVYPARPRQDAFQIHDSFRDQRDYSRHHQTYEGYGDAPISTKGVTMSEQDAEDEYADHDPVAYNRMRRRLERPSKDERNDSGYASGLAQTRPERRPQFEGHDSGYASHHAESQSRLTVSRTQSAPIASTSYDDVEAVYDFFVISEGKHLRVDGNLDTGGHENFITTGTLWKLGLNPTNIKKYSQAQETYGIGGSCDILGWIQINWYMADDSERRFCHQFDVVDSEEEHPLVIGRPTLNREKLIQRRIDKRVTVRKQLYKTGKRLRTKRPKDTYEAPTMIVDYPPGPGSVQWITLTPEDEVACRQAASSANRMSDLVQAIDGRQYRVPLSEDRTYYSRHYS